MRTCHFASAAALGLALLATAAAQNQPAPAPAADKPAATVAGAEPTQHTVTRDKDTLSVDFPDEDIKTILRNVADLFELNIVVPDTLVGKTSIKLRDVTWRQIFDTVLSPAGYTYVEEGNIIKVVSRESLLQEPTATEVFILNNAKAADIKPTVDGLVEAAAGGKILIDARSNALVITERPSRMTRIRAIIEKLDKATDQVMIESKFVEVTDRDIRNIGVNWASLSGVNLGARQISNTFSRGRDQDYNQGVNRSNGGQGTTSGTTDSSNSTGSDNGTTGQTANNFSNTVLYGTVFNPVASTTNLPSGSVVMPSTSTSVTSPTGSATEPVATNTARGLTDNQAGTTSATTNVVSNSSTSATTSATDTAFNNLLNLTNTGTSSRLASAVFTASDFNVVVSALKTNNNTKVVSNPTIVTLNNTEGFINIGQEFPVPSYTYNSERGTFEVSGFTYKPIGVILKVTPQVNAQGTIRLAIEPEVSQQNGTTTFGGAGGAAIPIIATRKVKTQVSLKDGYTVGIGGLINYTKDHGGTKVPVLGSVPILGRLFSSKSVNDTTSNLLIFITAKTVSADGATGDQVFSAAALEATGEHPAAPTKK